MFEIELTGAGSELQGVGRLPDGRAVFVPGGIPGERVEIEITRDKGRFCEASLVGVVEKSPDRVAPGCPAANTCGGCQARHIRYERTLEMKRQRVRDALERIGGVEAPWILPTLGCEDPDCTRNKAEYPIAIQDGRPVIGACAAGSRRIVPLADCLSQHPLSAEALKWTSGHLDRLPAGHLKYLVTRVNRAGEMMLVFSGDAPVISAIERVAPMLMRDLPSVKSLWYCQLNRRYAHALDGRCTHVTGAERLEETLCGLRFGVSPQSFFQVNPVQAEKLYEKALEAAGVAPGCGLNVLDAYCGAGTITLCAARWADHATGIEIVPPAIVDAKRNAEINHLSGKARFICADAAREIPALLGRGERFDAVILDPPRKGADPALLDAVARACIPVVSYVSCDPATLARDVKILRQAGYALEWAQPVDMFPWTGHCETVCKLFRSDINP